MQFGRQQETPGERRYDPETLRQVTGLAQQLQESRQESLTAEQIEGIGEELGLGRAFVRQALRQLAVEETQFAGRSARAEELRGLAAGWGLCAGWILAAWLASVLLPAAAPLFTLLLAPLAAVAAGCLIGKRQAAMGAAAILALALALLHGLAPGPAAGGWLAALAYLAVGGPLGAWLAAQGARAREHFFPREVDAAGISTPALLDLLVAVQRQLGEQERRRAFLSIAVADAPDLRRDAPDELVSHTFGQLEEWVEGLVLKAGGDYRGTVDDGLICTFPTEAAAVSVARELQEGMSRFNAERSRVAAPLRLRCGITAGRLPEDAAQAPLRASVGSLAALEAAFIERAAALQAQADPGDILVTGELAAAALVELRSLAPLTREAGDEPVFSWRAGQRSHQRP